MLCSTISKAPNCTWQPVASGYDLEEDRRRFTVLSGDDSLTLPLASVGGKGVISVVANIVPADVKALTDLILEGDFVQARKWHEKLFALSRNLLGLATNPIPIKTAMGMLDLASDELRLPMTPLEDSQCVVLRQALRDYGLLKG